MYLNMASILFFKCLFLSIFRITSGLPNVTEGVEGNLQYESIIIECDTEILYYNVQYIQTKFSQITILLGS